MTETIQAFIGEEYPIQIPLHFGRYDYIRTVGTGSFSVVALVYERSNQQQFACKICSRSLLMEKNIFDRFEREVRIMQTFHHPNLVHLFDIVYDENLIYLIMEYCMNGELFQVIVEHGKLEESISRKIFAQLIEGMTYIHMRDIAHRDLKPENILLDENLNPKITDFGLCHQIEHNTLLKTPCGSPFYAPPEVIANQPYDGKKSDVWSLGVVLYTMVTGSLPWKETNQMALFRQIMEADFIIPKSIPPTLRDLIQRLLRVDPTDRPDMQDIANHPWLSETDELIFDAASGTRQRRYTDNITISDSGTPIIAQSSSSFARSSNVGSSRKQKRPLIVKPNVALTPTSTVMASSFSSKLYRTVPPSSAKR